jgi:polysaccharide export outer membrane protein
MQIDSLRRYTLKSLLRPALSLLAAALSLLLVTSCQQIKPKATPSEAAADVFETRQLQKPTSLTPPHEIESLSRAVPNEYRIGEGDVLNLQVWYRPELSNPQLLVAPDGVISLPRIGEISVSGKTREEASDFIREKIANLYVDPEISLSIAGYRNNKAYVLGRVRTPGIVHFPGPGTLVEAITMAGGIPGLEDDTYAAEVSILRGNDQLMWIDIAELLHNGNMQLNARIQPNDIIFVPAIKQELIYVMGEVKGPRALGLRKGVTFLDAIWQAGGPTEDANLEKAFLIRWDGERSAVKSINLAEMISKGQLGQDVILKSNDIIYISPRGMAEWNYMIRQITPTFRMVNLSDSTFINLKD